MTAFGRRARSSVLAVALVATLVATITVGAEFSAQRDDCCAGKSTVATLYAKRDTGIDRLLVTGDAQVFAALAQDPLLRRPEVLGTATEFAYRAQRPGWGYLAWALSLGQPDLAGWALILLTILACGAAVGAAGALLQRRSVSPWWALALLVVGVESVTELTPELAAFAFFAAALLLWDDDRRGLATAALCASVLTRETMLVGVGAFLLWNLFAGRRGGDDDRRRLGILVWPFACYGAWAILLRLRVGHLPFDAAGSRTGLPGSGIVRLATGGPGAGLATVGLLFAVVVCAAAVVLARHDVLTWIAVGFLAFSTTLGPVVWLTHAGFIRVLLPLYGFGLIAIAGALRVRSSHAERIPDAPYRTTPNSPRLAR
jgi:hypothetical protein